MAHPAKDLARPTSMAKGGQFILMSTRSVTNRSSSSADRTEGRLQEIVSVRFSDEELRRVQAYAVIVEKTPNSIIREACSFFLSQKIGTPEYNEAVDAYHRRHNEAVEVLEQFKGAG